MLKFERARSKKSELMAATARDFSGGYNVLDSDSNLSSKYATKFYNVYNGASNKVKVRYGYELFANVRNATSTSTGYIVNITYYAEAIICVMSNGEIVAVFADMTVERIWDATFASSLPGSPAEWSATTFASFEQFNGELIICNGIDKPLIVNSALEVDYLQDLATLSNLNTPTGRYVTTLNGFLVIAGDPVFPNRLHFSSKDTSGTWYGDPAPNDGTYLDVGSSLRNASTIKGIHGFRGKLIVAFEEGTVIVNVGTYDADSNHVPAVEETVQEYGSVSHRTMIDFGDDMLMLDGIGVPSLKRTVFSGTIRPERLSDLIDPEIASRLTTLPTLMLEEQCFSVFDRNEGVFMFFIPNATTLAATTETVAYVYTYRPSLNAKSWARFDDLNFTCATRSLQGNVFFGDYDGKLWIYGSANNPIYKDKVGDEDVNDGEGNPVEFTWEMPWSDFNKRGRLKKTKFVILDAEGEGAFTMSMFVDRIMLDDDLVETPLLTCEFIGGDALGYGGGGSGFGGGRITSDEHGYTWPATFRFMKLRFSGSVESELSFAGITFLYQLGGFLR